MITGIPNKCNIATAHIIVVLTGIRAIIAASKIYVNIKLV